MRVAFTAIQKQEERTRLLVSSPTFERDPFTEEAYDYQAKAQALARQKFVEHHRPGKPIQVGFDPAIIKANYVDRFQQLSAGMTGRIPKRVREPSKDESPSPVKTRAKNLAAFNSEQDALREKIQPMQTAKQDLETQKGVQAFAEAVAILSDDQDDSPGTDDDPSYYDVDFEKKSLSA